MDKLTSLLTQKNFNIIMATAVFIILVVPVGIANVYLGFVKGESPCLLCGHERFGMVLVGILGLFMIRYGVRIKYIATTFMVAFWFIFEGLRHIGNHAQRDIGMGFGEAMFGLHTYTWAFVVYWAVILAMALMMFFIRGDNELGKEVVSKEVTPKPLNAWSNFVLVLSGVIVLSNTYQFFMSNGMPPYGGSGSPARFTPSISKASDYWDNYHWYENFIDGKSSLLGTNQGPKPHIAGAHETPKLGLDTNSANSPIITSNSPLSVIESKELGFAALSTFKKGNAGGIAYDKANDEFAIISTGAAAYFTDESFAKANAFATIDQVNGMDIPISVDAAFWGAGELVATAYNKTLWGVKRVKADEIDSKVQWKYLREVEGDLMPSFKGKRMPVMTTRAKKAYTLSLAKDPDSRYAYMVSISVKKSPQVILLKLDTKDNQISEETILEFSKNLTLKDGAKVSDFYITGSDIVDGKMLALSKAYNTLLVIDLASKQIVDSYPLPDIADAHDLAIKDDKLFVLSRENGKDKVFVLNNPL